MGIDKRPCFFKIMLGNLNTEYLKVPPAFMKHLPSSVSNKDKVILKGPCGRNWQVSLVKIQNDLLMVDGVKEFIRDQSLGDSECLILKYDGNMCFSVEIFDKTGMERVNVSITNSKHDAKSHKGKMARTHSMISSQVEIKSEQMDQSFEEMDFQAMKVNIRKSRALDINKANSSSSKSNPAEGIGYPQ